MSQSADTNLDATLSPLRRMRMDPIDRLAVTAVVGGGVGAVCGGLLGGQLAGRQYLAERAHRLPTTVQGWFFYQKWKNYRVILGGMRGASKYAARVGGCVVAFAAIESAVDQAVGEIQAASSAVAGLATAVGVSLVARLPRSSTRRACIAGLGVGLVVGGLQDLANTLGKSGTRPTPAYIEWARRKMI
ncbi:hypothetical protein GGH94_003285 [Coemansia aciculifera]|uniref:Tim17-domain-containing protein n=1 Tax=Coemansia aciculifera TaxID=417176 RepID=A0A9W8IP47_9FUNG|nr:hypothetical protein GGH94_003285 [Coemansia aciculifera]